MKRPASRRQAGRRGQRVARVVRQVVSETLVTELNDPRLAFVTVTAVDLSPDLRLADIQISVLGDAKAQEVCLQAIRHAHGRIQERVANALEMKFCPVLRFHRDDSVKRSVSISAVIAQARAEDEAARADRIRRGVELPPADETDETDEVDETAGADTAPLGDDTLPGEAEPEDDPGGTL
ncbi:MAG: 30S ribosome-binding factor RbfA [Planctomycetes bacterium]|nr:30S ribosome-binding factor RbfA [Planctomycetota bacterium]